MEMDTYRYHGHSMSDPGSTYRTRDEIAAGVRQERDPIERMRKLLLAHNVASANDLKALIQQNQQQARQLLAGNPQLTKALFQGATVQSSQRAQAQTSLSQQTKFVVSQQVTSHLQARNNHQSLFQPSVNQSKKSLSQMQYQGSLSQGHSTMAYQLHGQRHTTGSSIAMHTIAAVHGDGDASDVLQKYLDELELQPSIRGRLEVFIDGVVLQEISSLKSKVIAATEEQGACNDGGADCSNEEDRND